ncbi:hypothetical protein ABH922_001819 [Rhodococcus sp. 27YEA15]
MSPQQLAAHLGRRASGAAGLHEDRRSRRVRTRAAVRCAAVSESRSGSYRSSGGARSRLHPAWRAQGRPQGSISRVQTVSSRLLSGRQVTGSPAEPTASVNQ